MKEKIKNILLSLLFAGILFMGMLLALKFEFPKICAVLFGIAGTVFSIIFLIEGTLFLISLIKK